MTPDAPIPSTSLAAEEQRAAELREAQFTRKLVLAVLSTLQHKGILKAAEVDALLLAARRAADASAAVTTAATSTAAPQPAPAQPITPPASTPPQTTEVRASSGIPMKVRAEPARPIALHTQPPAPAPTAQPVTPTPEPAEPQPVAAATPEEAAAPTERPETGEVRRLRKGGKNSRDDAPAKAPPIFDIQID
ncbi:hypothetical protein MF271_09015 [Deinococcus sp. KNUC1210]|uniref:hypothetical protein n=1 Tax=Deinococcus sp. KNUC1210 TaxID=2917691 RepID=UPI001EF094ED|nr:hypothetical protein [Deinococcus sp. KNUC1210]ULH16694.1 hypothetical protein MF271_09015 [Deinococcus sp. KNUC1210]